MEDSNTASNHETLDVPSRWQSRFAFFDAYGNPADPAARAGLKQLSPGQRLRVSINVLALFFGPIYFAFKGMWRKALSLLGISLAVGAVMIVLDTPRALDNGVAIGFGLLSALTANYAYYLHVRTGHRSWNPFEGLTRTKSAPSNNTPIYDEEK